MKTLGVTLNGCNLYIDDDVDDDTTICIEKLIRSLFLTKEEMVLMDLRRMERINELESL